MQRGAEPTKSMKRSAPGGPTSPQPTPPAKRFAPPPAEDFNEDDDGTEPFCWSKPLAQLANSSAEARSRLQGFITTQPAQRPGVALAVPPDGLIAALHDLLLAPADIGQTVLPLLHAYRPAMIPILASCVQRQLQALPGEGQFDLRRHERLGYTFTLVARLLCQSDHVLLLLDQYYQHAPSPFERVLRSGGPGAVGADVDAYLDIARTAASLLEVGYTGHISWAPVFDMIRCAPADSGPGETAWREVRWYASRCVAQLLALSTPALDGLNATFRLSAAPPPSL
jgi:hypothetical protein